MRAVEIIKVFKRIGERPDQLQSENLKVKDNLGDLSLNGRMILKLILHKVCVNIWKRYNWFMVGSSDALF